MGDADFQDHFSVSAPTYVTARPKYPGALFETLVALTQEQARCWDCATGNGQAAVALAEHFEEVIATDGSRAQLAHAVSHPRVSYREALAERSGIEDHTVDLTTVAAALHWFANDKFYDEVRRVSKPGAVLAAWSYGSRVEVSKEVDEAVLRFAGEVLGPYWPEDIIHILSGYRTLPFPFENIAVPEIAAVAEWDLDALKAFIRTWSGFSGYVAAKGEDPMPQVEAQLLDAWGPAETTREVRWPLHFRVGRVE